MTKILVVEDNLTLLESIAFELEMREYEVVTAEDGQVAINLLEASSELPDLIVSDIAMPEVDGYKLLEQVRANDLWQAIPFIFLTAFDSKNAIRIGKGLGVDDYLTKPFDPDDLIIAVENKLKRTQTMQMRAERRLDETRRELVNLIAHELRTPLTAIYGSTDMLEMSLEDVSDELTERYLQLLRSGTNRLNRLVERIVTLVQIDSERLGRMQEVMSTSCDLNKLVNNSLEPYTDANATTDIEFQLQLSAKPVAVYGIEKFLQLIVDELLDNAIKFSDNSGIISIETRQVEDQNQLIIEDHGRGIPKDQLDKVWGRFIQIQREKYEQQGMGIGLYIVRALVEAHGGNCDISSQLDQGTRVVASFPLRISTK